MGFIVYLIVILIVPIYFQIKVMSTYRRYSKVRSTSGLTGKEVAEKILQSNGIYDVTVHRGEGELSDYYDPKTKQVVLSPHNYDNPSVAGTAVSAHEVGHAIQHAVGYKYLNFRSALFPLASIGGNLSFFFIIGGVIISILGMAFGQTVLLIGIGLFALSVLFQVITLPVEFDASKRAMTILTEDGYISGKETRHAKKVLNAAAMTYVAATAVAIAELLRLVLMYNNN